MLRGVSIDLFGYFHIVKLDNIWQIKNPGKINDYNKVTNNYIQAQKQPGLKFLPIKKPLVSLRQYLIFVGTKVA